MIYKVVDKTKGVTIGITADEKVAEATANAFGGTIEMVNEIERDQNLSPHMSRIMNGQSHYLVILRMEDGRRNHISNAVLPQNTLASGYIRDKRDGDPDVTSSHPWLLPGSPEEFNVCCWGKSKTHATKVAKGELKRYFAWMRGYHGEYEYPDVMFAWENYALNKSKGV